MSFYRVSALLLAGVALAVLIRIAGPSDRRPGITIRDMKNLHLVTLNGRSFSMSDLFSSSREDCFLLFSMNQCYSCVARGFADLKLMRKSGVSCFALAVHDDLDSLRGWMTHESFAPVFMLHRVAFLERVDCPMLPVLVHLRHGRIRCCRFITP